LYYIPEPVDSNPEDIITMTVDNLKSFVTFDAKTRTLKFKISEIKRLDVKEHEFVIKVEDNYGASNSYTIPVVITNTTFNVFKPPEIVEEVEEWIPSVGPNVTAYIESIST